MSKATPGPWAYIKPDGHTVRHPQVYSDTGPVCNATWLGDGRLLELEANARLIASAPDLLQALQYIEGMALCDEVRDLPNILQTAREAIARATGAAP